MLSRSEFDVMLALKKTPTASQRAIASECGMSLGTVNAVVKSLGDRGLVEGGALTAEGEDELSPYKVRNAVIMAAGLSSRMAKRRAQSSRRGPHRAPNPPAQGGGHR